MAERVAFAIVLIVLYPDRIILYGNIYYNPVADVVWSSMSVLVLPSVGATVHTCMQWIQDNTTTVAYASARVLRGATSA